VQIKMAVILAEGLFRPAQRMVKAVRMEYYCKPRGKEDELMEL
jgi:hypothetical protein